MIIKDEQECENEAIETTTLSEESMFDLRQWLRRAGENLEHSLERSWELGEETWLPTLGAKQGSHNGIPHLRNIESYLNRLCQAFCVSSSNDQEYIVELSPIETYIILAAILFHDIGRIQSDSGHGTNSNKMLEQHWAEYGIPSKEMANIIGQISEYHAPDKTKSRDELAAKLTVTSMAPYGRIRLRELAALLRLVDDMDGAFTRVLPEYLRALEFHKPPGVFRALIQDVEVNADSQTIYTVLGDGISSNKYADEPSREYVYKLNEQRIKDSTKGFFPTSDTGVAFEALFKSLIEEDVGDRQKKLPTSEYPESLPSLVAHVENCDKGIFFPAEWLLTLGLIQFDEKDDNNLRKGWNRHLLLASLMADLRKCKETLRYERAYLTRLGIHIQGWALEYKEHLYDECGTETIEAIFYQDYIRDIAQCMWELSTQIFGRAEFTYNELASVCRETNMDKIRLAVKRLSILTENLKDKEGKKKGGIWAGPKKWRWLMKRKSTEDGQEECSYMTIKDVNDKLLEISETRVGEIS